MRAIDASDFKKTGWRPDNKPKVLDYLADFSLAGRAALKREGKFSRLVLFEVYCLGGAGWKQACKHLGVSELTGAEWLEEIKGTVGKELIDRGIYPVKKYFLEPSGAGVDATNEERVFEEVASG